MDHVRPKRFGLVAHFEMNVGVQALMSVKRRCRIILTSFSAMSARFGTYLPTSPLRYSIVASSSLAFTALSSV